jgi:hypothetical protein
MPVAIITKGPIHDIFSVLLSRENLGVAAFVIIKVPLLFKRT